MGVYWSIIMRLESTSRLCIPCFPAITQHSWPYRCSKRFPPYLPDALKWIAKKSNRNKWHGWYRYYSTTLHYTVVPTIRYIFFGETTNTKPKFPSSKTVDWNSNIKKKKKNILSKMVVILCVSLVSINVVGNRES